MNFRKELLGVDFGVGFCNLLSNRVLMKVPDFCNTPTAQFTFLNSINIILNRLGRRCTHISLYSIIWIPWLHLLID